MKATGILIVLAAILAPLFWFVPLMGKHDTLAVISQYVGSAALIAMGLSQFMATRLRWQQSLFGGLDRIYVLHKWIGIGAMAAVLLHDTMDADIEGLGRETFLTDLAETLGEFSLYSLLALVVITVVTFIPYHLWRWTHKFMGAIFVLSAFHYVFMIKPFSIWDPVGLYVSAFCLLGFVSYLYTLMPFAAFHGRYRYTVTSVKPSGDAVAIGLTPVKRGMRHSSGQFAFVGFDQEGLTEVHPFTISKAPEQGGDLRFTIKPLGDYTHRLTPLLKEGTAARLSPAFGHFGRRNLDLTEIWIAGGIGVTPFAAFAQELDGSSGQVHFFYSVAGKAEAAHLEEFERTASKLPNFHLHLIETRSEGRLTAKQIETAIGGGVSNCIAYFCGPEAMRQSLRNGLLERGLPSNRFRYEEFEIRSGIGLRKLLSWVLQPLARIVKRRLGPVEA